MTTKLRRREALAMGAAALASACAATKAATAPADALGDLDALGVADRIRRREITALEAVDAAIARAERIGPQVNPFATLTFDAARARAKGGGLAGPFAGVPTVVKDLSSIAGQKTMFGSRAFKDNVAKDTDAFVEAALAAGLVSIGKSTTPEFGFTATTEPVLTGATRNPWNPDHSSGGSSGGSAAAVAAGIVPIATASDGGGSIRIPASCCGLFGLKPSRARLIGSSGRRPPIDISVDGCLSHTVRDAAAFLAATERRDAPYPPIGLVTGPARRRLRIGLVIPSALGAEPDPEVRAAIEATAALCRGLGHEVRETGYGLDGRAVAEAFQLYWAAGAAQDVETYAKANPAAPLEAAFEPLTLGLAGEAQKAGREAIERAIGVLKRLEPAYAEMFASTDVLLTPVLASPPPRIGELATTQPYEAQRDKLFRYVGYTPLQNAAGAAAMSVPLGWSKTGLPIGSHFAARAGDESTLLSLAFELEAAEPWTKRRPPVWAG